MYIWVSLTLSLYIYTYIYICVHDLYGHGWVLTASNDASSSVGRSPSPRSGLCSRSMHENVISGVPRRPRRIQVIPAGSLGGPGGSLGRPWGGPGSAGRLRASLWVSGGPQCDPWGGHGIPEGVLVSLGRPFRGRTCLF